MAFLVVQTVGHGVCVHPDRGSNPRQEAMSNKVFDTIFVVIGICSFMLILFFCGIGRTETFTRFERGDTCVERTQDHWFGVKVRADEHGCGSRVSSFENANDLFRQRLAELQESVRQLHTTTTTTPDNQN